MNTRIFITVLFFSFALFFRSQQEDINRFDSLKNKHGKWILWLNESMQEIKDSAKAVYVRYTYYDHGENIYPMGPMGDKDWKLNNTQNSNIKIGNAILLDGDYKWFDKKNVLRSHQVFKKGEHVLYLWYYPSSEPDQIFDYNRKWLGQPLTYRILEYKKDGSVKGRYYMRKERNWQFYNGGPVSVTIVVNKKTEDSLFVTVSSFLDGRKTSEENLILIPAMPNVKVLPMETIKNGNSVQWYVDGKIYNPIRHGTSITWHFNGNIRSEGNYVLGVKSGEWKYWDKEGKEIQNIEKKAQDQPRGYLPLAVKIMTLNRFYVLVCAVDVFNEYSHSYI